MVFDETLADLWTPRWDRPSGCIDVAVIGLGGFATEHALPALDAADCCRPTALVSGSAETARRIADDRDVEAVIDYEAFHDGAATDAYDAVYVATPNARHLEFVRSAASFGKHVICEKPLEVSPERAEQAVEACDAAGVTLMTAYRMQTHPAVRRLRAAIAEGLIGEPAQIHSGFSLRRSDPDAWQLDHGLSGGGPLVDVGVYPLNTTRFLLGADPVAVDATTTSRADRFDEVEEHVSFRLTFPGGTTASCTGSFNAYRDNRLLVLGTEGWLSVEPAYDIGVRRQISVERDDRRTVVSGTVDEVREEFDYFARCVLTGTTPDPDGRDGATDVELMDAIYDAAERGERVRTASTGP